MSIPALLELRRVFPDSHITLHTRSWADELFGEAEFIDELVTFDKHRWPIKDVLDNSEFLKGDNFELAILLPNSFESALTSFLTRIPRRIGFNKDVRGLLLTDPIAVPEWKGRMHEAFYYLHLIGEAERRVTGRCSVTGSMPDGRLGVSDQRRAGARATLRREGVGGDSKVVAFVAGSANSPEKRWPAERFAALNDLLQREFGAAVVLLGSKDECDVAQRISDLAVPAPIDLTGRTSLGEAMALLSIADVVVSNDTGLAHVAAAVGTPTLAIFGPTDPDTTRPLSPVAQVLYNRPMNGKPVEWPAVDEVFRAAAIRLQEEVDDNETGDIP